MKKKKEIKVVNSLSEIPLFKSEDKEREFWETHDLSSKLWDTLHDPEVDKETRSLQKRLKMTDRRR